MLCAQTLQTLKYKASAAKSPRDSAGQHGLSASVMPPDLVWACKALCVYTMGLLARQEDLQRRRTRQGLIIDTGEERVFEASAWEYLSEVPLAN